MPWSGGVYTRGYPSWSNDAANNLPISATKFDTEDNDFATGLNNCLTKDGLNIPTGTLNWSQTASAVMNLLRGSDGDVITIGRSGGSNNPVLHIANADASGMSLNVTGGALALAIAGTSALQLDASRNLTSNLGTATISAATTIALQTASTTALSIDASQNVSGKNYAVLGTTIPTNGIYLPGTNILGFATNTLLRASFTAAGSLSIVGNATPSLLVNGTGTAANSFIVPAANAQIYSLLGAGNAGPGIQARWDSGSSNRYIQIGNYDNVGTWTPGIQLLGAVTSITDDANTLVPAGFRGLPFNVQNTAYAPVANDRGRVINMTASVNVTINTGIFSQGDVVTLILGSGVVCTIVQGSGVTMQWGNGGASTGNRTMTGAAIATLLFYATNGCVLTGSGLS